MPCLANSPSDTTHWQPRADAPPAADGIKINAKSTGGSKHGGAISKIAALAGGVKTMRLVILYSPLSRMGEGPGVRVHVGHDPVRLHS